MKLLKLFSDKNMKYQRIVLTILFVGCVVTILYFTILNHEPNPNIGHNFNLFWSYKKFFNEKHPQGWQICSNILLFMPYGFLLAALFLCSEKKRNFCSVLLVTAVLAALYSGVIEYFQYQFKLGFGDCDDVFNNTLGAVLGGLLFKAASIPPAWQKRTEDNPDERTKL